MKAVILLCIVIWSYPLGTFDAIGKAAEQVAELRVCEDAGQQFLEVWRVARFTDGTPISGRMEVRVPWGADTKQ